MTLSGHAIGHVTNTEKRLPGKLLYRNFFHWFITLCIDFVSFLKGQILRGFQNIEKFVIFWKMHDFQKAMHSYVSNVSLNRNASKKAGFNEKPPFLYHLKKPDVRPIYIESYPSVRNLHYQHTSVRSNKATRS